MLIERMDKMKKSVLIIVLLLCILFVSCNQNDIIDNASPVSSNYLTTDTSSNSNTHQDNKQNTTNTNHEQPDDTTPSADCDYKKHYEIDLNLDNYQTYLTYTSETTVISGAYHNNYTHNIDGVLSFAYYENVVISFDVTYTNSSKTYHGVYDVLLNAAGDAVFYADTPTLLEKLNCRYDRMMNKTFTIKSISGKVIFNI